MNYFFQTVYYIYSHGGKIGHNVTATLESNGIPPSKYCLLFNYHMQGLHIEELEVKLNDQTTAIWYRNVTEQGAEWKCAAINVTIGQPDSHVSPVYSFFSDILTHQLYWSESIGIF